MNLRLGYKLINWIIEPKEITRSSPWKWKFWASSSSWFSPLPDSPARIRPGPGPDPAGENPTPFFLPSHFSRFPKSGSSLSLAIPCDPPSVTTSFPSESISARRPFWCRRHRFHPAAASRSSSPSFSTTALDSLSLTRGVLPLKFRHGAFVHGVGVGSLLLSAKFFLNRK